LFIVSRFREELGQLAGQDRAQASRIAITRTLETAGRTVLFSGLTVAAALTSLMIFPQAFLRSMGYGGVAAVVVAMLAALTILPAVLCLLGHRIDAIGIPRWLRPWRQAPADVRDGHWYRLARVVMRHAVVWVVVIVIGLAVLGAPFLGVHFGGIGTWVLPKDAPTHIAERKRINAFGGPTSDANIVMRGAHRSQVLGYAIAIRA